MIHVVAIVTTKPVKRDQLLKAFIAVLPLIKAEKGKAEKGRQKREGRKGLCQNLHSACKTRYFF